MDSLWVAKTGLDAQQTRMSVVSNNLANVNTIGFKRGRALFEDLLYQNVAQAGAKTSQDTENPTGLNIGTGVRIVGTEKNFAQGSTVQTGNQLDVAISGRGFFQVQLPDGELAYTRDGIVQGRLDRPARNRRRLRDPAGDQRPGRGPVDRDRRGRHRPGGRGRIHGAGHDRHAADHRLPESGRTAAGRPEPVPRDRCERHAAIRHAGTQRPRHCWSRVHSRGSNVNVVEELVAMIETQRAYEMNSKAISTSEQMLQYLNNNL